MFRNGSLTVRSRSWERPGRPAPRLRRPAVLPWGHESRPPPFPRVNALKSDHMSPRSQKALYNFGNIRTKWFDKLQKYPQRLESYPEILMRLPCPPFPLRGTLAPLSGGGPTPGPR